MRWHHDVHRAVVHVQLVDRREYGAGFRDLDEHVARVIGQHVQDAVLELRPRSSGRLGIEPALEEHSYVLAIAVCDHETRCHGRADGARIVHGPLKVTQQALVGLEVTARYAEGAAAARQDGQGAPGLHVVHGDEPLALERGDVDHVCTVRGESRHAHFCAGGKFLYRYKRRSCWRQTVRAEHCRQPQAGEAEAHGAPRLAARKASSFR